MPNRVQAALKKFESNIDGRISVKKQETFDESILNGI